MKTAWQCQLCDAWVEGDAICECALKRGMQPQDAWPMPDGDEDIPVPEPAPVGGETWT